MNALYFVSKRLQAVVAALICLALVQLLADQNPPPPTAVRVKIAY